MHWWRKYYGQTKERTVSAVKSIQTKIIGVVIFFIVVVIAVNLGVILPMVSSNIEETLDNSMSTVTRMAAKELELVEKQAEESETELFTRMMADVKVEGYDSSYVYVVRVSDSMMMYHPTADKIGQPVENEVVRNVISRLNAGEQVEQDVVKYAYRDTYKYAGYTPVMDNQYIVVISVDYDDAYAALDTIKSNIAVISLVCVLCGIVAAFLIGKSISNPIKALAAVIQKMGNELNFKSDNKLAKLQSRGDEVGAMSRAIETMRDSVQQVLIKVDDISERINTASEKMEAMAERTNEDSSDNSATAEELAASMQETSATTEVIGENIVQIDATAGSITDLSGQGQKLADEIMKRADRLKGDAEATSKASQTVIAEVAEKSEEAIEKAKAVEKIQYLTNAIMEIATQTSLLALNASIEAARAGEAGRGFSVVAGEIAKLADQSADTVGNITSIVQEVDDATRNMSECLQTMLDFMNTKVMKDYGQFIETSIQYNTDADTFRKNMTDIHGSISQLAEALQTITASIEGINTTVGEAAKGVTDIAQKTSDVVGLTGETLEHANVSADCAGELKEILSRFQL